MSRSATGAERLQRCAAELEADPALCGTPEQLAQFGRVVREQPGAVRVLCEQGEAFGMVEWPDVGRIVADREPERVVAGIMTKAEDRMSASDLIKPPPNLARRGPSTYDGQERAGRIDPFALAALMRRSLKQGLGQHCFDECFDVRFLTSFPLSAPGVRQSAASPGRVPATSALWR